MKTCPMCKKTKHPDEFNRNRLRSDGLDWRCKKCKSERDNRLKRRRREAIYYEKDKNKVLMRVKTREVYGSAESYKCAVINCESVAHNFHHLDYDGPHNVITLCVSHHEKAHLD